MRSLLLASTILTACAFVPAHAQVSLSQTTASTAANADYDNDSDNDGNRTSQPAATTPSPILSGSTVSVPVAQTGSQTETVYTQGPNGQMQPIGTIDINSGAQPETIYTTGPNGQMQPIGTITPLTGTNGTTTPGSTLAPPSGPKTTAGNQPTKTTSAGVTSPSVTSTPAATGTPSGTETTSQATPPSGTTTTAAGTTPSTGNTSTTSGSSDKDGDNDGSQGQQTSGNSGGGSGYQTAGNSGTGTGTQAGGFPPDVSGSGPTATNTGFPTDVTGSAPTSTPTTPSGATTPVSSPPVACGGVNNTKSFGILPVQAGGVGQIFDPSGQPYVPRGVNVLEGNEIPASTLQSTMPGINFVRYAIYDYPDPSKIAPYVQSLNQAGIVVELENHNNGAGNAGGGAGQIFSGSQLSQESSWYASVAKYFISDPYVWYGTNNEPSTTDSSGQSDPAALSQWQLDTYNAIRGTGNQSPIMLELNGWADPSSFGSGYNQAAYANMTNTIWDMHFYGWVTNMSTDQATNDQFLANAAKTAQNIKGAGGAAMPVVIGEYGNSTTGQAVDPNGTQVVNAVQNAVKTGVVGGSSAWAYMQGGPGDGLVDGGGSLTQYGQQVASYIAQPVGSAASSYACAGGSTFAQNNTSNPTSSTTQIVDTSTGNGQPAPGGPLQQPPASQTPLNPVTLNSMSSTVDGQIAAIQTQINAAAAASTTPSLKAVGE